MMRGSVVCKGRALLSKNINSDRYNLSSSSRSLPFLPLSRCIHLGGCKGRLAFPYQRVSVVNVSQVLVSALEGNYLSKLCPIICTFLLSSYKQDGNEEVKLASLSALASWVAISDQDVMQPDFLFVVSGLIEKETLQRGHVLCILVINTVLRLSPLVAPLPNLVKTGCTKAVQRLDGICALVLVLKIAAVDVKTEETVGKERFWSLIYQNEPSILPNSMHLNNLPDHFDHDKLSRQNIQALESVIREASLTYLKGAVKHAGRIVSSSFGTCLYTLLKKLIYNDHDQIRISAASILGVVPQFIPTAIVLSFPVLGGASDTDSPSTYSKNEISYNYACFLLMVLIVVIVSGIPLACLFFIGVIQGVMSFVNMDLADKARVGVPLLAGASAVVGLVGENQTWSAVLAIVLSFMQVFGFLYIFWTAKRAANAYSDEMFCFFYRRKLPGDVIVPLLGMMNVFQCFMHWMNISLACILLYFPFNKVSVGMNICIILLYCFSSTTNLYDGASVRYTLTTEGDHRTLLGRDLEAPPDGLEIILKYEK